jgi:hypothetical protein
LKYSLNLIATALEGTRRPTADEKSTSKKLRITVVHMDSESYILHAMADVTDIKSIGDNFDDINWPKIYDTWKELCALVSIDLEDPIRHRIDYIPPRVGLLIDDEYLYAGRCSMRLIGDFDVPIRDVHSNAPPRAGSIPRFNLDVGENEYQFYKREKTTKKTDRTFRAMRGFKGSVVAYRQREFNAGIRPIWKPDVWMAQLKLYIEARNKGDEITFVSATSMKFEPLVRAALEVEAKVKIYLHDAKPGSKVIPDLRVRLGLGKADTRVTIHGYKHPPTFRAVIVAEVAIGLQPYISADTRAVGSDMTKKLPLCFIITRNFSQFQGLRDIMLKSLKT